MPERRLEFKTHGLCSIHCTWDKNPLTWFHCHNEVEINFYDQGWMRYSFGSQKVTIPEGKLGIFWAANPHKVDDLAIPTTMTSLTIPLPVFLQWPLSESFSNAILHGEVILESDESFTPGDRAAFARWHTDLNGDQPEQHQIVLLEVEARLRRLSREYHPDRPRPAASVAGKSKVDRMMRMMTEHYAEPICVRDIAEAVGLNHNYAVGLFKRTCGLNLIEYLTQMRVTHAQRLLATTDMKILDIAMDSGFPSLSHFYTVFQRLCGRSPRQYRVSVAEGREKLAKVFRW